MRSFLLALCVALPFALHSNLSANNAGSIEITIAGLRNQNGVVRCGLFASADDFPLGGPTQGQTRPIVGGGAVCVFSNLPAGVYAISVNHDANRNGKTDTNLVGIPTEGWAVSNNARPTLRPPRFSEAQLNLAAGQTLRQTLRLNY